MAAQRPGLTQALGLMSDINAEAEMQAAVLIGAYTASRERIVTIDSLLLGTNAALGRESEPSLFHLSLERLVDLKLMVADGSEYCVTQTGLKLIEAMPDSRMSFRQAMEQLQVALVSA